MKDHQWVRIVITPINVVNDPEVSSEPVIFIGEADEVEAAECAQYGCLRCDETLTSESVNTRCQGDNEAFDEILQNFRDEPWTDKP
jgi:hypothetical protein